MLKFKTSCAVLAYLSSNLLNEVGLSLFRYFEVGLRVCDIVVNKFTFAISSSDEFLLTITVRVELGHSELVLEFRHSYLDRTAAFTKFYLSKYRHLQTDRCFQTTTTVQSIVGTDV